MTVPYLEPGRAASATTVERSASDETFNRRASTEEVPPEGLALLLTGLVLCRAATGTPLPRPDSPGRALLDLAARAGLTPKALCAAFPPVRVMPDCSTGRTTVICRLPGWLGTMPLSVRRVWKGALSTDGAGLVVFTAGEAGELSAASRGVLVGGQVCPLEGAWRGLIEGAATRLSERGSARGVALRFLDARLVGAERSVVESRLVLAGMAGPDDSSGGAECLRGAPGDPRRIHLTRALVGDASTAGAAVALTADCTCSLY